MRIIFYAILIYLAYRVIKGWLLRTGGAENPGRFSEPESNWSYPGRSGREKDVTERSRVVDDQ
ncbi:MAG: hypothetical protein KDK23_03055 [Leptospiraceae bacterium]|nr:hypothetical protein [Leptospiraceae bacterium]